MTPTATALRDEQVGLGAAAVAVVCWSAGNVMVTQVPMPGLQIAFWRILLGAVVYTVALRGSGRRLRWDQLRRAIPTGAAISLEIGLFFVALKSTTLASASVIGALVPLVLFGVASRRFGEEVTRFVVATAVVSLAGVALVMFGSASDDSWSLRGDLLAVVALGFFSAYFAFAKSARAHVPAFELQAAIWIVGTVVLAPIAWIDGGGLTWPSAGNWAWLAALLAVPGTGHLLMNWSHARVRLTVTSMLTLAVPVLSTLGGVVFLGQSVGIAQVAGMAVVLAALGEVVRREARLAALA